MSRGARCDLRSQDLPPGTPKMAILAILDPQNGQNDDFDPFFGLDFSKNRLIFRIFRGFFRSGPPAASFSTGFFNIKVIYSIIFDAPENPFSGPENVWRANFQKV